ncbi:MAG: pyruvate dehydrogenase E1 component [Candidatus Omnitrophota bacterium]|jgi:pyruvate dehydrogenase E1 component
MSQNNSPDNNETTTSPKISIEAQEEGSGVVQAQKLAEALEVALSREDDRVAHQILNQLTQNLRKSGKNSPVTTNTSYLNTIAPEDEPKYPGDREMERRIKSYIRWNAMSMVVSGNRDQAGIGGHISTFASAATLYDVGWNHFYRGNGGEHPADQVYFQGHASPGPYARAYVEGRLTEQHLRNFRQELAEGGGLSSYPHPYLMPNFWQFPSVSMGLAPITSIYQARFNRYMKARGLVDWTEEPRLWTYMGDGEVDEVESLGALSLAGRDKLDNLIFVVNCNLQRLDGPVRGNGKIIQELEAVFRGNGWNVIKCVWGSDWDPLLAADKTGLLRLRMLELLDGEYQKYVVEPGSYIRKHFFGKYPELLPLVNHLSDDEIKKLKRGGHDPQKVYAAYDAAIKHKGQPTVILAKTVKGYGLGEAGEGKNISHQQKKMNEKELREFRKRFNVPINDEDVVETPFYRPPSDSAEAKYLKNIRKKLGRMLPERTVNAPALVVPGDEFYQEFRKGSDGAAVSTTMAIVRIMSKVIRDKTIGKNAVPIIPDEARTFGMETMFREVGIYAADGQKYEPVDSESLIYYREEKNGQILEEGINEAGAMSSFIAAGSSYATHSVNMIPFYIYYSMFGFQRVGDLMWQAADQRTKGFVIGATAGRTALNGEGLQHQDGHSHILSSTIPTIRAYDPAYAFEIATIVQDGLDKMYAQGEEVYYYITVHNDNYAQLPMPDGAKEGIIEGIYKLKPGQEGKKSKVHLFGSGAILNQMIKAQEILERDYDVSCDLWSVTSYRRLRHDAINCQRWNMLHPDQTPKKSYLEKTLEKETGTFVAASDNMRIVSDQIAPWVQGGLFSLGTDGFGRSDTRERLRRFFEVDAESAVIGVLYALMKKGERTTADVKKAIQALDYNPEKVYPFFH